MGKGFIKIDRGITDHFFWIEKPYDRARAWIDLLLLANWKDTKELYNGELVQRKRGTVTCSKLWLADRWGWDRKKVTAFLKILEVDNMATTNSTTHRTTITIENWDKYQSQGTTNGTTDGTTDGQPKDNQGTTTPHTKESKRIDKNSIKNSKEDIAGWSEMLERKQAVLDRHPEIKNGKFV